MHRSTSAEILLNLIHGNSNSEFDGKEPAFLNDVTSDSAIGRRVAPFHGEKIRIGIDIGYDQIRMVKIDALKKDKHQIIGNRSLSYYPEMLDDDESQHLIQRELMQFCRPHTDAGIWCVVPPEGMAIKLLKIAKAPQSVEKEIIYSELSKIMPAVEMQGHFSYRVLGDVNEDGERKRRLLAYSTRGARVDRIKRCFFPENRFKLKGISTYPFVTSGLLNHNESYGRHPIAFIHIGHERIDFWVHAPVPGIIYYDCWGREFFDRDAEGQHDIEMRERFNEWLHHQDPLLASVDPVFSSLTGRLESSIADYRRENPDDEINTLFVMGKRVECAQYSKYLGKKAGISVQSFNWMPGGIDLEKRVTGSSNDCLDYEMAGCAAMFYRETINLAPEPDDTLMRHNQLFQRYTVIGFLLLIALGVLIFIWQGWMMERQEKRLERFENAVNKTPVSTVFPVFDTIIEPSRTGTDERKIHDENKLFCIAVISEIVRLTPKGVYLTGIRADFGHSDAARGLAGSQILIGAIRSGITLEGVIAGKASRTESVLAEYLDILERSPLLAKARVHGKSHVIKDQPLMLFTVDVDFVTRDRLKKS